MKHHRVLHKQKQKNKSYHTRKGLFLDFDACILPVILHLFVIVLVVAVAIV